MNIHKLKGLKNYPHTQLIHQFGIGIYALLKKELQSIYDNPQHILHRVKAIIDAVKESEAKTVNVTINKDNKDFTFKYETRITAVTV